MMRDTKVRYIYRKSHRWFSGAISPHVLVINDETTFHASFRQRLTISFPVIAICCNSENAALSIQAHLSLQCLLLPPQLLTKK